MPFYEYVCTQCGAGAEVLQKISDPPKTECPHCHAQALIKQVSAAGFRLKGGGWYETDFKSKGQRNVAGDGAAAAADGKGEAKADGDTKSGHGCAAGACGCAAPAAAPKTASAPASTSTAPATADS